MTICISAIAQEAYEEVLVFSTDHMVTTQIGQFEHSIKKYKKINSMVIAMLAGNTLLFDRCLKGINENLDFISIKKRIKENMAYLRRECIRDEVYSLYDIDDSFVKELLKQEISNPFMEKILGTISEFSLNTNILLIGFDDEGKAQISEISEEGYIDFRDVNFHAIGSGTIQAINTLLFQRHSKEDQLNVALYNVVKAKKNAEVAEGVGKETELLILRKKGCTEVSNEDLKKLENVYQCELKYGKNHQDLNSLYSIIINKTKEVS